MTTGMISRRHSINIWKHFNIHTNPFLFIMKKIALFLSIVVAAIACDKTEPVTPPVFDFANPDVLVPYQGSEDESLKLNFNVNVDWTAELDQTYDWLTITPKSGKAGDASITVIATPNENEQQRTAVITVKAGVSVLTFDVVQEGFPALTIEPTEVVFDATGGSQDVTVNANVEYVVTMTENNWLTYKYNAETGVYTLTAAANEAYASRSVTITLSNNVDNVSESIVVSQNGRATVLWTKSFATDLSQITLGSPIHMACVENKLAISTGAQVHILNAQDGSYVAPVTLPSDFVVGSMTTDDAGHVLVAANDAMAYGSAGDVYCVTSLETFETTPIAQIKNDVYGYAAGNLKVTGDVTKDAALVMFTTPEMYWIGCNVTGGVAGESKFGALYKTTNDKGEPVNTHNSHNGCVYPLGTQLGDGMIASYYPYENVYYCADPTASGAQWTPLTTAIFNGNDNNCTIDVADYAGKKYAVFGVGCHFTWTDSRAMLFDITDPAAPVNLYNYSVGAGENNGYGPWAEVVLAPAEDALYLYFADLNRGVVSCVEIK